MVHDFNRNFIVKMQKFFLNTTLKIPYRYREIVKKPNWFRSVMTSVTMFTRFKIHPASYGFSWCRSYMAFDIQRDLYG